MRSKIDQDQIEKIADAIKDIDKDKLTLITLKRYGKQIYHIRDGSVKGVTKRWSLKTEDKGLAHRLFTELTTKVEWEATELGGITATAIAKLDRETRERTWDAAFEACQYEGLAEGTVTCRVSGWSQSYFDGLRNQPIISTTRSQMQKLYKAGNIASQRLLGLIVTRATDEGWLIDRTILTKIDKQQHGKESGETTAAIPDEAHYAIIEAMEFAQDNWQPYQVARGGNKKRKGSDPVPANQWDAKERHKELCIWLKLMFLMGASNQDARTLKAENIDWDTGHIIFRRGKWTKKNGKHKQREPIQWPMCEELKELVKPLWKKAIDKPHFTEGYLLPLIAETPSSQIIEPFRRYAEIAGVKLKLREDGEWKRIVIHSYRYRMAELLCTSGYSEREAQALMGHRSKAVHHAYSKGAKMSIKPLDQQRKEMGLDKLIPVAQAA